MLEEAKKEGRSGRLLGGKWRTRIEEPREGACLDHLLVGWDCKPRNESGRLLRMMTVLSNWQLF